VSNWVLQALRTGIKSTTYPKVEETAPGVTPGLPQSSHTSSADEAEALSAVCPTRALGSSEREVYLEHAGQCVHCFRCSRRPNGMSWDIGYEWASLHGDAGTLGGAFEKSLHVFVVDGGDCGACLNEFAQLNGPYYNFQRLGIFVTPTPRHADVMVVVGPVTDHMSENVRRCYNAIPEPRRVIAVGACAVSGGVFGPSFAAASGVHDVIPVDVDVPGCPPPPLAMLHALLLVTGRAKSAGLSA
jgi:Ni,Fe-hydrogenase III small subunit